MSIWSMRDAAAGPAPSGNPSDPDARLFHRLYKKRSSKTAHVAFAVVMMCVIITAVAVTLLILLFPRPPDVTDVGDLNVTSFVLNTTRMDLQASLPVTVNNKNYAELRITKSDIDVTHQKSGVLVGQIVDKEMSFPARTDTQVDIGVSLATSDVVGVTAMYTEWKDPLGNGTVTFRFHGPVTVKYLGVSLSFSIDEVYAIKPTNLVLFTATS